MNRRLVSIALISFMGLSFFSCQHEPIFVPASYKSSDCDADTVYFVNDILPVLRSSCATSGCHNAISAEKGIVLTDYSNIMGSDIIDPFDPDDSEIMEVITENDPDDIMPPPPKTPLTPEMIQLISTWISQGALNNECISDDCDSVNVTFSNTIWPIIQNTCKGCHSGNAPDGGLKLENYSQVATIAQNGNLLGVTTWGFGYKPMPYGGAKLSACKIAQIRKWIVDGYPNN